MTDRNFITPRAETTGQLFVGCAPTYLVHRIRTRIVVRDGTVESTELEGSILRRTYGAPRLSELLTSVIRSRWSWWLTIVAAIGVGGAGLFYVAALLLFPSTMQADVILYTYFDKRWMVALFGLAIALVYFPLPMKRVFDLMKGQDAPTQEQIPIGKKRFSVARCCAALLTGFTLAVLDIGPNIPTTLESVWDGHELVHLGPLQRIAKGGLPYVEARTQYGPGHQLITYAMMRDSEFTLRGFRASVLTLNIVAESLWFAVMLYAFGWCVGLAAIVVSRLFCPITLLTFIGWYVEFRWLGPLVVGLLLVLTLRS